MAWLAGRDVVPPGAAGSRGLSPSIRCLWDVCQCVPGVPLPWGQGCATDGGSNIEHRTLNIEHRMRMNVEESSPRPSRPEGGLVTRRRDCMKARRVCGRFERTLPSSMHGLTLHELPTGQNVRYATRENRGEANSGYSLLCVGNEREYWTGSIGSAGYGEVEEEAGE